MTRIRGPLGMLKLRNPFQYRKKIKLHLRIVDSAECMVIQWKHDLCTSPWHWEMPRAKWRPFFSGWFVNEGTACFIVHSSCSLDMFYFPYDTQLCALDFGNIVEPAEMMNISTDQVEIDTQSFYASSEFTVEASHIDYVSFEVSIWLSRIISAYPPSNCPRRVNWALGNR